MMVRENERRNVRNVELLRDCLEENGDRFYELVDLGWVPGLKG